MEKKKTKPIFTAKELAIIAIFAAITAVLAQIAIPIPLITPMPISFGLVAVYMTGILLKPKHAVLAQICYLALGAVGIPVFGNFRGGIGALFGPTGGYLLVYPIMAWIVAKALNGSQKRDKQSTHSKWILFLKAGVSMCIAHTILYSGGTAWLSITSGNSFLASLSLAVVPFIPLDIVKILFCIFAIVPFRARLLSMKLLMLDDTGTHS